jgi:hypothetical protein
VRDFDRQNLHRESPKGLPPHPTHARTNAMQANRATRFIEPSSVGRNSRTKKASESICGQEERHAIFFLLSDEEIPSRSGEFRIFPSVSKRSLVRFCAMQY